MPQSLAQIYIHLVFSTKNRKPFLTDQVVREKVHAYLVGICREQNSPALIVGGVEDHVHLLFRLNKTAEISQLVRDLKRSSSKWIKNENPMLSGFQWQRGYGAFSISPSHIDALKEYIANQEAHHQQETFQEEFRRLCLKYAVELDERYVWD